ncbi:secreted immunoglobulin domain 1 [Sardina pilchardus]|uniref:secreted immunoglobulin domain 1 n=1 Tax=Sardina pilchardus TaxID=27697 RepID=UPI002E150A5A
MYAGHGDLYGMATNGSGHLASPQIKTTVYSLRWTTQLPFLLLRWTTQLPFLLLRWTTQLPFLLLRWTTQFPFLLLVSLQCASLAADTGVAVTRGQSVALGCPLETSLTVGMISWYKQSAGEGPNMVLSYSLNGSSRVCYGEGFRLGRFSVQSGTNDSAAHQLLISTTEEMDSATYYCGISNGDHERPPKLLTPNQC